MEQPKQAFFMRTRCSLYDHHLKPTIISPIFTELGMNVMAVEKNPSVIAYNFPATGNNNL
jgi:hypothetical protein